MAALIIAGFVIVLAMLLTMARFDILKWLGYAAAVDIAFTILMFSLFAGTFSGIIAGSFAGIFMTAMLYVMRASLGCKKLRIKRTRLYTPYITWVYFGPENYRGKWSRAA